MCIGNTFAMFEATLILALIAQRFELALVSPTPGNATEGVPYSAANPYSIRLHTAVTLRPGEPIRMRLSSASS